MAALLRRPRIDPRIVPTVPVEINQSHPLAAGLVTLVVPGAAQGVVDLVSGAALTPGTGGSFGSGLRGPGLITNDIAQAYTMPLTAAQQLSAGGTLLWAGSSLGNATGSGLPWMFGTDNTADNARNWMIYNAGTNYETIAGGQYANLTYGINPASGVDLGVVNLAVSFTMGGTQTCYAQSSGGGISTGTTSMGSVTYSANLLYVGGNCNQLTNLGALYNRALSAAEIQQLFLEPFSMLRPAVRRLYVIGASAPSGALTGNASSTATASGTLSGRGALAGSAAGAATASAPLKGAGALAGSAAATAAASGTLAGQGALTGTGAAAATSAATLTGTGALAGTGTALATSAAQVSGAGALAGSSAATATGTGALTSQSAFTGTGTATATASAMLTGQGALAGSATATATASGTLTGTGALAGTGTASATLTSQAAFTGTAAGTATASASLTGAGALAGTGVATSNASAPLTAAGLVTGSAAAAANASASMSGAGRLTGNAVAVAMAGGTLTGFNAGTITGTAAATGSAQATLTGRGALSGAGSGQASAIGIWRPSITPPAARTVKGSATGRLIAGPAIPRIA